MFTNYLFRLLSLYIACLSVLKCMCPDYSDIVSADPLGIELETICPHFIPTTTIEELITLVGSVNLFTKSLAKVCIKKFCACVTVCVYTCHIRGYINSGC